MRVKLGYLLLLAALFCAFLPVGAAAQEAIAVITEVKLNRGDVQIQLPGKKTWEKPGMLQSLYVGTRVQASKDAAAVVLFTDGARTVTINEKNSPFEIKAGDAKGGQGGGLKDAASALLGKKKAPSYVALAVRGGKRPPVLVAPRNTKMLTDAPTLQWMGMERQPGTVRVFGPQGVIWSAENISLTQLKYPPSAPRLKPGVEYAWVIEKKGFPVDKVPFKILPADDAKAVQQKLAALQDAAGLPKTTQAILKAGLLFSNELYYEAREILTDAVNEDPDEPTLHFLLAEVYEKTGLKDLASEEYSESEFLLKKRQ